ncbi:MAG: hypothetical protein RhofKO_25120 [Rhodothermales bacterium]
MTSGSQTPPLVLLRTIFLTSGLGSILVVWAMRTYGGFEDALDADTAELLGFVFLGVIAVNVLVLAGLRRMVEQAGPDRRPALLLAGWAVGEGGTLIGAVHYLLTGSFTVFIGGAAVLLLALFVLMPLPADTRAAS